MSGTGAKGCVIAVENRIALLKRPSTDGRSASTKPERIDMPTSLFLQKCYFASFLEERAFATTSKCTCSGGRPYTVSLSRA